MPVPVPPYSRPPAHPTDKLKRHSDPARYTSLPTSYSLDSLDTQRSASHRPHRIWEEELPTFHLGFPQGLTTAANAGVIKGARAQACLPPITSLARRNRSYTHSRRHSSGNMVTALSVFTSCFPKMTHPRHRHTGPYLTLKMTLATR